MQVTLETALSVYENHKILPPKDAKYERVLVQILTPDMLDTKIRILWKEEFFEFYPPPKQPEIKTTDVDFWFPEEIHFSKSSFSMEKEFNLSLPDEMEYFGTTDVLKKTFEDGLESKPYIEKYRVGLFAFPAKTIR